MINPPIRPRLFHRYRDLAPQLVPLDYTTQPDVRLPYELIGSMPELKVRYMGLPLHQHYTLLHSLRVPYQL